MISFSAQLRRDDFEFDVTFESEAHVLGVFGPSGAGKTTLINIIAGLDEPEAGRVVLGARTLFDSAARVNVPTHRRRVGVVFQEHRLFPHLSVRRNLTYGCPEPAEMLGGVAELLELTPLLARRVAHLSGGERQRVALGRALLSDPHALLLDEPLASLDHRLRQQILPHLRRVCAELSVPIVYVSHELHEILQLTDQLLVLDAGRLRGCGRYADLVHRDDVLEVVHDRGMTNVLEAVIVQHHPAEGVSELTVGASEKPVAKSGTTLLAPLTGTAAGEQVRIMIQPWDIALATNLVTGVSIQNQIPGTVRRRTTHQRRVLVEIDIGVPVLVEISNRSALALQIDPGRRVHCLIKSHAIRYAAIERAPTPISPVTP